MRHNDVNSIWELIAGSKIWSTWWKKGEVSRGEGESGERICGGNAERAEVGEGGRQRWGPCLCIPNKPDFPLLLIWLGFLHRLSRNEMGSSRDIGFNWLLWKGALEWLRNRLFSWVWILLEHLGLVSVYCLGHEYLPRFSSYKDIFEVCHEEGAVQDTWVKGTGSYYFLKAYWVLVKMERFFPQTLSYLTFQNWCSKYDFSFAPKRKPRLTNIKWLK